MDCFVASAPRNDEGGGLFSRYRAIAFFSMDCRVKPGNDETGTTTESAHAT
jgi:hypothetical protein